MPPKSDKPATRSATQEQAAVAAAQPGAEDPTAAAPSATEIRALLEKHAALMESHHELLVKHDRLATKQQSDVQDLCHRLDSLQLRSGRTSPHRSPQAASTTVAAPERNKGEETASTATGPAQVVTTTASTTTQPAPAIVGQTAPSPASSVTPQQGAVPAYKSSPWASWDPKTRNEVSFLLDRRGLSLTKLFDDEPASSNWDPTSGRETAAVINPRQLHCKHETLGSFDGDPNKLEGFISRVRDIGRKRVVGWEDAVLAAVPDALTGHAAKWHASLTKTDIERINTLEDLFRYMRRAFPANRAQLRADARQRQWDPNKESAMNYYYDKVLLMRQAFGDTYAENALAQDVADGLQASMRAYVRLPSEDPTLQNLQDALAEWEPVWREVHGVSITESAADKSGSPTMTRSRSAPSLPSTAEPASAPLPPPPPAPPRPPRSEQRLVLASPTQKTSASVGSLAQRYDPSRIVPAANGQPRMYRLPDSTRVMRLNRNCVKCGQQHFDFEHDHLLTAGQIHVLDAAPYEEFDEAEEPQASFIQSF